MRPYCWPAPLWWILIKHQMCSSCSINQPRPLQLKHTVPSILQSSCHRLRVIFHTTQHTKHPSLALTLKCSHRQNRVICGRVRVTYYYVYYFSCSTLWGSSDRKEPCYAICHTKPELSFAPLQKNMFKFDVVQLQKWDHLGLQPPSVLIWQYEMAQEDNREKTLNV